MGLHWGKKKGKRKHILSINMIVMMNKILCRGELKLREAMSLPQDHTAH